MLAVESTDRILSPPYAGSTAGSPHHWRLEHAVGVVHGAYQDV